MLLCLFGTTPFLTRLLLRHPEHYLQIAKDGPDKVMQQIATLLRNTPSPGIDADSLGKTLRELRAQAALTVAIADISGHWTLQQVTRALSDFAQQILQCAIDGLLLIAEAAGGAASTGHGRVLEVQPDSLHARVPFFVGSRDDVADLERFLNS